MKTTSLSEVAHLMRQIQEEYEAAERGLSGLALGTAQHAFITARLQRMSAHHSALRELVGEQEAGRLLVTCLEQGEEGRTSHE